MNDIFTPATARTYINIFVAHTRPDARAYRLDEEIVHFDKMTDEQAMQIATAMREAEIKASIFTIQRGGLNS